MILPVLQTQDTKYFSQVSSVGLLLYKTLQSGHFYTNGGKNRRLALN